MRGSGFCQNSRKWIALFFRGRGRRGISGRSDIDLTLIGSEALNLRVLYRIMDEIDDLLLPNTFDLSILRLINDQEVREHIRRVGVVFYVKVADSSRL